MQRISLLTLTILLCLPSYMMAAAVAPAADTAAPAQDETLTSEEMQEVREYVAQAVKELKTDEVMSPHRQAENILGGLNLLREQQAEEIGQAYAPTTAPLGISKALSKVLFGSAGMTADSLFPDMILILQTNGTWLRVPRTVCNPDKPTTSLSMHAQLFRSSPSVTSWGKLCQDFNDFHTAAQSPELVAPLFANLVAQRYTYTTEKSDTSQMLTVPRYLELMRTNESFTIHHEGKPLSSQHQAILTFYYVEITDTPVRLPDNLATLVAYNKIKRPNGPALSQKKLKEYFAQKDFRSAQLVYDDGTKTVPLTREQLTQIRSYLSPAYKVIQPKQLSSANKKLIPMHRLSINNSLAHQALLDQDGSLDTSKQTTFNFPLRVSFARLGIMGAKLYGTAKLHELFRSSRNNFIMDTMMTQAQTLYATLSYKKEKQSQDAFKQITPKMFTFVPMLALKQTQVIKPLIAYFLFYEILEWLESKTGSFSLPLQEFITNEISFTMMKNKAVADYAATLIAPKDEELKNFFISVAKRAFFTNNIPQQYQKRAQQALARLMAAAQAQVEADPTVKAENFLESGALKDPELGRLVMDIAKKTVLTESEKKQLAQITTRIALTAEKELMAHAQISRGSAGEPLLKALGPIMKNGNLPALIPLHGILNYILFGSSATTWQEIFSTLSSEQLWNKPLPMFKPGIINNKLFGQDPESARLLYSPLPKVLFESLRSRGHLRPEMYNKTWFLALKKAATAMLTLRFLDRAYHRTWMRFLQENQGQVKSLLGAYLSPQTTTTQRAFIKAQLYKMVEKGNDLKHDALLGKLAKLLRLPTAARFINEVQPVITARAVSEIIANLVMLVPILSNAVGFTDFIKTMFKGHSPAPKTTGGEKHETT